MKVEILIQRVWSRNWDATFLTKSQAMTLRTYFEGPGLKSLVTPGQSSLSAPVMSSNPGSEILTQNVEWAY